MEYIKKDLATSLTSLIFVVISITGVLTVLLNSPSGDSHYKFTKNKSVMNNSINEPLIILGNNIAVIKEVKSNNKTLG